MNKLYVVLLLKCWRNESK